MCYRLFVGKGLPTLEMISAIISAFWPRPVVMQTKNAVLVLDFYEAAVLARLFFFFESWSGFP